MNIDKILDIRFTAPVGVMILSIFLFSPTEFLKIATDLSTTDWAFSFVGVLGIGFMISTVVNFFAILTLPYLKNPEKEFLIWRNLGRERKENGEDVPNQVHKRWNMAMANFGALLGLISGYFIAHGLNCEGSPSCFYYVFLFIFIFLFIFNGCKSERDVRKINGFLSEEVRIKKVNNKSLQEWQKLFVDAMTKKFGSSSQEKRLAFMEQDLKDIAMAIKLENGELKSDDHRYQDPNERIAGLFSNIFVLAEQRGMDLEKELQKALDWYLDPNTKPSSK